MPRIQLLSDLHFEHHVDGGRGFIDSLWPVPEVDVLVLAGDICTVADGLLNNLTLLCQQFPQVILVPGNHEYYGSDRGNVNTTFRRAQERNKNLHVLNRDVLVLGGQRFLGATLWFPPSEAASAQRDTWSDFRCIKGLAKWYHSEGELDRTFLRREMQEGDVVITHYLPSWQSVHPRWATASTNCFFVSDMEPLMVERKPALWLHGHTHDSSDYQVGPTRVVCNPFGYANQRGMLNPRYTDEKYLDLP